MVAGYNRLRHQVAKITSWLAGDKNGRLPFQKLYFAHHHQRPELSFVDPHTRSTVFHHKTAIPAFELRTKHIGIRHIILGGAAAVIYRTDKKMPTFCLIQQTAEEEAAVKSGKAHPLDIGAGIDIGQVRAISDDAHLIFMHW